MNDPLVTADRYTAAQLEQTRLMGAKDNKATGASVPGCYAQEVAFGGDMCVKCPTDVMRPCSESIREKLSSKAKDKMFGGAYASDGSTAAYYVLPSGAAELQDLISHRDMNAQMGEIFRACYRYGIVPHSPRRRDIKKIIFYAQAELARLDKLETLEATHD